MVVAPSQISPIPGTQATEHLAAFCAGLRFEDMPSSLVERAKLLMIDLIGGIVRARHESPVAPSLLRMASTMGWSNGEALLFGDPAGYAPSGAAFLNGALGHALDFDDTHAAGTLHPGAPIIPAAIAAAQIAEADGKTLLTGIVAGYETACRIAMALPAADHYARGFHPSATCGVFGAAAAAWAHIRTERAADRGGAGCSAQHQRREPAISCGRQLG
jgi:2-methylcitrate dehydratase PrpD